MKKAECEKPSRDEPTTHDAITSTADHVLKSRDLLRFFCRQMSTVPIGGDGGGVVEEVVEVVVEVVEVLVAATVIVVEL